MAKILVVGSGGREHAIVSSFAKSKKVSKIYATPGNPGMLQIHPSSEVQILPSIINIHCLKDIYQIVLDKHIDIVFVGPEQYLEQGIADYLDDMGVAVVAPNKRAAQLETSKVFAKELMSKYDIPTASFLTFTDLEEARKHLHQTTFPVVIKADGLAAGKGVIIAENISEGDNALVQIMKQKVYGNAGKIVIIEEYLQGWEASLFAVTDGSNYQLTIVSQDHKKLLDEDKGPNTGGMGAFAPVDKVHPMLPDIDRKICKPLFEALKRENIEYKGILYIGLMFTDDGPQVLEFNCRLGDPETQALLPLLDTDIFDVCNAIINKEVCSLELHWLPKYAVNVVAASKGYPNYYQKDKIITISDKFFEDPDVRLYYSGVTFQRPELCDQSMLTTAGGRVLSVTAIADSLKEARIKAYEHMNLVFFEDMFYRKDIALKE